MAEPIPDEEKLALATHYLLSAPPAEIKEVLADVKVILDPPSLLTDGVLKSIFKKYNVQNFEQIEYGEGKVVVSEFGELDAKHFVTAKGEVVQVDHVTQKATAAGEGAPKYEPGPLKEQRVAVLDAMQDYCASQFTPGSAECNVHESKDGNSIVAVISGQKANLRNYWTGKWRSEWHFDVKAKQASGKVRINIHYFEDGNVQMEQSKDVPKSALSGKGADAKAYAEACVDFVAKNEGMIQDTLEEMFISMSVETFKDMRRVLPITKTKMDWSGASLKLASGMGKAKGQ